MQRRAFISNVTLPLLGVCSVCLAACEKQEEDIVSITNNGNGGNNVPINFLIDLQQHLVAVGSTFTQNNVLVIRYANTLQVTSFIAVQASCPHAGGILFLDAIANQIACPVHGSRFSSDGIVLTGPAVVNLKKYKMELNGNMLRIFE